jgi:hypothetical protein
MYTALVLNAADRGYLISNLRDLGVLNDGWETVAHHVTLQMGRNERWKVEESLKFSYTVIVKSICMNDKVLAVRVAFTSDKIATANDVPHITIQVNRPAGGKPVQSNDLNWQYNELKLELHQQFELFGTIQQCV